MKKLPIDIKEKWVAALRSKKYKQIKGQLTDHAGGFCCLGVLAAECGKRGVTIDSLGDETQILPEYVNAKTFNVLTQIFETPQDLPPETPQGMLIDMNDDRGYSFKKIATWIEKNL
jgi:hypothetical protein